MTAPASRRRRWGVFLLGNVGVALAVSVIIGVDLGAAPYDAWNTALAGAFSIAPGTASWVSAVLLLLPAWLLGFRFGPGTVIGSFLIGALINLALDVLWFPVSLWARVLLLLPTMLVLYLSVSCIILSRLGSGPTEVFTLALVRRGLPLARTRTVLELSLLLAGFLLGGAVGPVTVIVVPLAGPALSRLLPLVASWSGLDPL